jgi:hypothetical protein
MLVSPFQIRLPQGWKLFRDRSSLSSPFRREAG